jgi:lipopolysaccharide transport system ATP-binding protein
MVAFSEVEKFLDTPVKRYSSGMYVRLAFAVAAHLETEILIVDEVLAVGDASFQKKCLERMKAVGRSGRTVLFVSHNLGAVQRLCGRSILLQKGTLLASGATEDILNLYIRDASQKAGISLEDLRERSGNGALRLVDLHIEDLRGNRVDQVQSGADFYIVIGYKTRPGERVGDVDIGISFHLQDETILSVIYSSYTGEKFKTVPVEGEFRCHVKRLPLSAGRYLLGTRVFAGADEADWPRTMVGALEVIEGDFYGTGQRGFEGTAPLMIAGTWAVAERSRT